VQTYGLESYAPGYLNSGRPVGLMVIADSPLFSTLITNNAAAESTGTALTIVHPIGFAITILSIQLITLLLTLVDPLYVFPIIAAGPALGLWSLYRKKTVQPTENSKCLKPEDFRIKEKDFDQKNSILGFPCLRK